jgi:hypothetical protein
MSASDFALSRRKDDWLQHPVLGDPSFDSFRRRRDNPICRGTWEHLGPVFPQAPFRFNGLASPVAYAPDVSVRA